MLSANTLPATSAQPKKLGGCTGRGFMPGKSGNPLGGSSRNRALVKAFARAVRAEMLVHLHAIVIDPDTPPSARVFASAVLVEAAR